MTSESPYTPTHFEVWETRMRRACCEADCQRRGTPDANSRECGCPVCVLAFLWFGLDANERGVLFAAMSKQGFTWPKETE